MASTVRSTTIDTVVLGHQKFTLRSRFQDFSNFLFDPEETTILGRTARSWGEICLFYLVFYSCLAGFFAAMMAVFYQTLDWNVPRLRGPDSLLRQNPGLDHGRDQSDNHTTYVVFSGCHFLNLYLTCILLTEVNCWQFLGQKGEGVEELNEGGKHHLAITGSKPYRLLGSEMESNNNLGYSPAYHVRCINQKNWTTSYLP